MSFGVCIVRGESRASDRNLQFLRSIFSEYPQIEYTPTGTGLTAMYQTLYKVQNTWPDLPSLVIFDSSITNLTRDRLTSLIEDTLPLSIDMLFLCHWLDSCSTYRSVENWNDTETSLKWTTQPSSQQAILYSVEARDFMITNLRTTTSTITDYGLFCNFILAQKKIRAATFTPNLIDFDINLVVRNEDYYKFNSCTIVPPVPTTNRTQIFLIYIVIFIIILLAAWSLLRMSPKTHKGDKMFSEEREFVTIPPVVPMHKEA